MENQEAQPDKRLCNICNVELIKEYKKCECRLCEDWGGCKSIEGYYFLKCLGCNKEFELIKTIKWEPDLKRGIY